MTFLFYFVLFCFIAVCGFLVLIIMLQEAKSMGLGSSFGGDSSDSLFGTSTAEVMKKITAYLAAIFLISCVVLSLWTASLGRTKKVSDPKAMIEQTAQQ